MREIKIGDVVLVRSDLSTMDYGCEYALKGMEL